jgi:hypothetical protein
MFIVTFDLNHWKQTIKGYVKGKNHLFKNEQIFTTNIQLISYKFLQANTTRFLLALIYLVADIQILL